MIQAAVLKKFLPVLPYLIGAAAFFMMGWKVHDWRTSHQEVAQIEETITAEDAEEERQAALAAAFERGRADAIAKAKPIIKRITREVEVPVFRDCPAVPDSVVRDLNTLRGHQASGKPAPAVPGSAASIHGDDL